MKDKSIERPWHAMGRKDVLAFLGVDERGLSAGQVDERLEKYGPNLLPQEDKPSALRRFMMQFKNVLIYVLLVAAVLTLALGEFVDSAVIFAVVIINAIIGFIQEGKAERAMEAIRAMLSPKALVVRDGKEQDLPAEELVPGDIVMVRSGDRVPADLRVVSARNAQAEEAALTGESEPVDKQVDPVESDAPLGDRFCMAYSSTVITSGQLRGVVVATGGDTEIGRIGAMVSGVEQITTPLIRKINAFGHALSLAIILVSAAVFLFGYFVRGFDLTEIFMAVVSLAVAAIPEGLPAVMTITLALGVQRMAKRNAIVRRLPAVETLGSVTVICSDKTGTLTKNEMTVQAILAGDQVFDVEGAGYEPTGGIHANGADVAIDATPALRECLLAGALCNDAQHLEHDGRWTIVGDPTEGALLVAAKKAGLDPERLNDVSPRCDAIPFESERQFMATLHRAQAAVIYLKGAVEKTIRLCDRMLDADGTERAVDAPLVLDQVERFAGRGLRVLAFARKLVPEGTATLTDREVEGGLTFLGLQAMMDPPRPEAVAAVRACQQAGIAVKMITGDHAITARTIAAQIGLDGRKHRENGELVAMTGQELAATDEERLPEAADHTAVFARVSPEQKLRLVEALQAREHVVAMTGDGVNDAPALKQANIGVAMGRGGTEVAKEAADMVLTDDNFASIEAAVEEGRCVFDNLTKFIVWTLPTNMGEGLVLLTAIAFGAVLPILPVQILWINMTTAVALGLMLAFEPKEPGIMVRPPRDPGQPILTGVLIERIVMVSLLMLAGAYGIFLLELDRTGSLVAARTAAVNVFVMVELFYLFNCRSLEHSLFHVGLFSNPWIWRGVAVMTALQLLLTYTPAMNRLFHTAPIDGSSWGLILTAAVTIYIVVEAETWLRLQWKRRRQSAASTRRRTYND
jgi:cation-transporting P-type ATPase F